MRGKSIEWMRIFWMAAVLVVVAPTNALAQKEKKFSAAKAKKEADKAYSTGDAHGAIDLWVQVLEEEADNLEIANKLGMAYLATRNYNKAKVQFKKVLDANDPTTYPKAKMHYANTLKQTGNYDEAEKLFKEFRKKYRGKDRTVVKRLLKSEIAGCELAREKMSKPLPVRISNLGDNINGIYMDFAPVVWGDTALVYSSLESDTVIWEDRGGKGEKQYVKMYRARRQGGSFAEPKEIPSPFNNEKMHVANGAFSPDGKKYFFSVCIEDKMRRKICDIYFSERTDSAGWGAAQKMGGGVNETGTTSTMPALSAYKKGATVLYFVSDREEKNQGGLDIYYSVITRKGEIKSPKNLGRKINTVADEITPFYDPVTGTMYFSSAGHPGFGGQDIFKTQGNMKRWTKPTNMNYPVNSKVDDMYYVIEPEQDEGFLVSNRTGSQYFYDEACCDDIYSIKWLKLLRFAVTGNVFLEGDTTFKPIDGAQVTLYLSSKDVIEDEDKGVSTIEQEETPIKADSIVDGNKYFFTLVGDQNYKLRANKAGYLSGEAVVSTMNLDRSDTLLRNLFLGKFRAYQVRNIYYDFNKFELRSESKNGLDSLLHIMQSNPHIIVEIGSHTDSVGNDEYNATLSQKRAESVVKYMIKNGIPQDRLTAKGYGESEPIAPNTNPDGSDNPEGRQLNRRTEFKIIGEVENLDYLDADEDLDSGRHRRGNEGE